MDKKKPTRKFDLAACLDTFYDWYFIAVIIIAIITIIF